MPASFFSARFALSFYKRFLLGIFGAMSVRQDILNLIININGDKAQNQLNDLRKKTVDLTAEMKGLKKGTQEYIDANDSLKAVNEKMAELKKQVGLTALNEKELNAELKKLKALKGSVVPFSDEFKDLQKQIDATSKRLYDVRNGVTGLASVFSKVKDEVKQFGMVAAGYLGFQFITSQFKNIIQGAGKLSDQLADIRRVSGMTADEVNNLNKSLSALDTRTGTSGLREIAVIAGKLGVAKEEVAGFTKAVDMLVVTLGDELGNADEVTTKLGKILNVFDGKVTGENVTKLGNAFVELANSGVATGGFIADFDQRLSGIAKTAGISLGALSGLGAGMEELGSRVESSTTAIQKLLIKIASDIPKAAKIAGQSTEEFGKLFANNATEALLKFSEGLVKNKSAFNEIVESMKDAGEEGARVVETITKMGGSADKLRERIDLGKKSIQETSAIYEGFALKNETLGATLDKLGKEFYKFIFSGGVSNFLKGAVQNTTDFISFLKQIPDYIQRFRITLSLLATTFIVLNRQLIIANVNWLLNKAAIIAETVAVGAAAVATLLYRAALFALAIVQAAVTGNIAKARAAWILLNAAFKASPIGALITLVVGLGLALDSLISKTTALRQAQDDLAKKSIDNYSDQVNKIENLKRALESENVSYETKKKILQQLIEINPEFAETLRLDAQGHLYGAESINAYIAALKRKGEAEAAQELSNEQNKKILALQQEREEWEKSEKFSEQARKKMIADLDIQIAKIQQVKSFYDGKVLGNLSASKEYTLPGDTVPGGKTTGEDASVAARRKVLEKLIEDSKAAYEKLNATDKAGQLANLALRAKYQKELDDLDNKKEKKSKSSGNGEYKRLLKEAQDFYKSLQKLKEDAAAADKSQDVKDLINLEQKYNDLHAKALEFLKKNVTDRKTYTEEEKLIIEAFNNELAALQKKQFGVRSDEEYGASIKATQDYFDHQKNLTGQAYADGKIKKAQYSAVIRQLDVQEKQQLSMVAQDYSATSKKANADLTKFKQNQEKEQTDDAIFGAEAREKVAKEEALAKAQLAVLQAPKGSKKQDTALKNLAKIQFDQDTEDLDKKSELFQLKEKQLQDALEAIDDEGKQRRIQAIDEFAQNVLSITNNLMTALNNLNQREFQRDKSLNDAKKKNYKKQLDDKLISQKQYDKKVADADAELAKKKHDLDMKAFKRQQALAIVGALINGAMAVTSTLAARPGLADIFTLGVARAIQVGLVVAATAAQVAAIASQAPPEQAAKGNWFRKGKKHKDGGIPVEIEVDEAVMKADAMTDNKKYTVSGTPAQITSKLNSMHGGVNWATGGTLQPKFRERPASINPNMARIMEQGGVVRKMFPQQNESGSNNDELFRQMITKQEELIAEVKNQKDRLHAVVSIKEYRETEKRYDDGKKAAGMAQ